MIRIDWLTDTTGKPVCFATRSAVRWRVPDSLVSMLASGTSWVAARRMRVTSRSQTMAPSIFASSRRRVAENSTSRGNPPVETISTSRSLPRTMSAPVRPRRIRSRPSRSSVPGATAAIVARRSSSSDCTAPTLSSSACTPPAAGSAASAGILAGCTVRPRVVLVKATDPRVTDRRGLHDAQTTWDRPRTEDPGGHDRPGEPEPGPLREAAVRARDRPDLAGEPHLAEGDRPVRKGAVRDGTREREADREVRGRLGQAYPAHGGQVRVAARDRRLGSLVEDSHDHVDPRGVQTARRPAGGREARAGHECLDLGDERAPALQRHRHAGPGYGGRTARQEEPARVGEADDADVGEVEAPDLVGRAEAVLDGTHEAQAGVPFPLELDDDVDEVLGHAWPGHGAVLGDVSDQQHGDALGLRRLDQRRRDLTNLGHVAGGPLDVGAADGLDGVDDDELGLEGLDLAEHGGQVGLARQVEGAGHRLDPLGTGPDLCGRLLTADVEDPPLAVQAGACGPGGDIEQERRLPDAGLTGDKDDRARDDAPAEHPVELRHPGGASDGAPDVHLPDRDGGSLNGGRRRGACQPHSEQRNAEAPRAARREAEGVTRHTVCRRTDMPGCPRTDTAACRRTDRHDTPPTRRGPGPRGPGPRAVRGGAAR